MSWALLAGVVGAGFAVSRVLPQLRRVLAKNHARGVSVPSLVVGAVSSTGWCVYGLTADQLSIAVTGVASALICATTALVARSRGADRAGAWPATYAAVLVGGLALGGPLALGLLLAGSSLAMGIPQLRMLRPGVDASGVSPGTWVIALVEGFFWVTVGVATFDPAVLIWSVGQTGVSFLILMRLAVDGRTSRASRPASAEDVARTG